MNAPAQGRVRLHDLEPELEDFQQAVLAGLSATPKTLPCKFFYDQRGSQLFDAICQLPEYYPTRTEIAILERCAPEIAERTGGPCLLLEYGSGSSVKIRTLLDRLDIAAYVPIDISKEHMLEAADTLLESYPALHILAVCADYSQPLDLAAVADAADAALPRVGFFPGSSIGNFGRAPALAFLRNAARHLGAGGALVVGADLKKDRAVLEAAYNDADGVTAAFNLNLLSRINAELGGDFDLGGFRHRALWNADAGRIEMHLESARTQTVQLGGRSFRFSAGESIHTENSYKYSLDEFRALAREAGFTPETVWTDDNEWFSVHFLRLPG